MGRSVNMRRLHRVVAGFDDSCHVQSKYIITYTSSFGLDLSFAILILTLLCMALLTIPEAIQGPLHEDLQADETVIVVVFRGEDSVVVEVLRKVELRHVQKDLCNAFKERFPLMCANLTDPDGQMFHDFDDMPFKDAEPNRVYEVTFELTRDMFWFDWADRKCSHSPDPQGEDTEMHLFSLE